MSEKRQDRERRRTVNMAMGYPPKGAGAKPTEGLDLDSIRARVEATTPGPWEVYDPNEHLGNDPLWCVANDPYHNPPDDDEAWPAVNVVVETGTREDAVFVACARADVPALLSLVDLLDAELADERGAASALANTRRLVNEANAALRTRVLGALRENDDGRTPLVDQLDRLIARTDLLDAAMHSVWLHGKWRWLTSNMTTEQREAAWAAVQRYNARLHPGEPPMPDRLGAWWREGADYAE
ncbi:MAG TPA: hypothetical protein VHA75_18310 [Rugosimonospora sp.]|nr:hypothetical protein [Rugosimonospora sp.]